jgi:hypothetical protein
MDILELDGCLSADGCRRLEELVFEAVRSRLDDLNSDAAATMPTPMHKICWTDYSWLCANMPPDCSAEWKSKFYAFGADICAFSAAILMPGADSTASMDRKHLLRMLAALAGDWNADGDYLIDWLAVDRVRAERQQPGDPTAESNQTEMLSLPAPKRLDFSRRRGRPFYYRMQDFAAEVARYCVANPAANQADAERHMDGWCMENWNVVLSGSHAGDWVAPTFRAIRSIIKVNQPPNGADNSARDAVADLPASAS